MTAPVNAEGIAATTTLDITAGRLMGVTDALGQTTSFGYSPVTGLPAPLLSSVTSPTGEHTAVTYTRLAYEPGVVVVNTVAVTDAPRQPRCCPSCTSTSTRPATASTTTPATPPTTRTAPTACSTPGTSATGTPPSCRTAPPTVDATYNSLHLLLSQKVHTHPPGKAQVLSQTQTWTYPQVTSVTSLPANYAKPTSLAVAYGDPQFGSTRTVTTTIGLQQPGLADLGQQRGRDDHHQHLRELRAAADPDGDRQARRPTSVTTDTLSSDGKTVKTVTTAVGSTDAQGTVTAQARTVATYSYNGLGQVTGRVAGLGPGGQAAGAKRRPGPDRRNPADQHRPRPRTPGPR